MKFLIRSLLAFGLVLSFVGASATDALAASKAKIDRKVQEALGEFRETVYDGAGLLSRAKGVLVLPAVKKGGMGIGAESGSGALLIGGGTAAYYRASSASIGFQLGGQVRREFILFMEQGALDAFRQSANWEIGVDGSVAIVTLDAGGKYNTETLEKPVLGFVIDSKGLMYNLTLEGQKISKINPD
jgi:lipid-binding SYLF domain-containing protein